MTDEDELLTDWKAVYGEQNPRRDPERMQYTDAMLALGTLLRREIRTRQAASSRPAHRLLQYNGESV